MNKVGIIESVGTGTQEMIKECKELGKPEPEYIERGNTFVVCFYKSIPTLKETVEFRQNKILSLLKLQNGLSSAEIKKRLGMNITERTLRRDLNHLREQGRLRLEGKGASAGWFLTDKDMS
jgi:ATP-dependent DNA helicase RecG